MKKQATIDVYINLPNCDLTPEAWNLAIHPRLFLDIKDNAYYVMDSLLII